MLNDACPPDKLCILLGAPAALHFCHAIAPGALSVKGTLAVRSGLWPGGSAATETVKPDPLRLHKTQPCHVWCSLVSAYLLAPGLGPPRCSRRVGVPFGAEPLRLPLSTNGAGRGLGAGWALTLMTSGSYWGAWPAARIRQALQREPQVCSPVSEFPVF